MNTLQETKTTVELCIGELYYIFFEAQNFCGTDIYMPTLNFHDKKNKIVMPIRDQDNGYVINYRIKSSEKNLGLYLGRYENTDKSFSKESEVFLMEGNVFVGFYRFGELLSYEELK